MKIVICGLTITSSWGNGHATTYRGLVRALVERGHDVLFLERDAPWYAESRDVQESCFGRIELYGTTSELFDRHVSDVRDADLVIIGSFVPEGIAIAHWIFANARGVTAFYDIDTPMTLSNLERGQEDYLSRKIVPKFDLYLSFTGGPTLERLKVLGARRPCAFYCSIDPHVHKPVAAATSWDLGYLGTYCDDRQPMLERLLLLPASSKIEGTFCVAGPQYPDSIRWPTNVTRIEHLAPPDHATFYASQRFTLNLTRADMFRAGHSPSVRLFEAAACGTPIISDCWPGIEELFSVGWDILIARTPSEILRYLSDVTEDHRIAIGQRARETVLKQHTAAHRARELEGHVSEVVARH